VQVKVARTVFIGVVSYRALGHVPPLDFKLFIFWDHFRSSEPHKLLTFDLMWLPIQYKSIQAYSFVTVYCRDVFEDNMVEARQGQGQGQKIQESPANAKGSARQPLYIVRKSPNRPPFRIAQQYQRNLYIVEKYFQ